MARKNRISIPNGTYHVTSRIVNRQHWFADPRLKDEIVRWMYGIAAFSGVELLSWCLMDNHFHILVHIPEVPERLRLDPSDPPASYAFGMRPAECRGPLWSPQSEGDGPPVAPPRPDLGFALSDEEMLGRLQGLYGDSRRVEAVRLHWARMRRAGNDALVDAEKARYCRRMYNVSQFVKTLKERLAQAVKRGTGHVGHVFEGRFHSGLVQGERAVAQLMSLYIDYNPHKARMVRDGERYRWSSFGQAEGGGPYAASCRAAYERLFGCSWRAAREYILAAFAARLPGDVSFERDVIAGRARATPAQLVKMRIAALSRGVFVGRGPAFARAVSAVLPRNFPRAGGSSLAWFARAVEWPEREVLVA